MDERVSFRIFPHIIFHSAAQGSPFGVDGIRPLAVDWVVNLVESFRFRKPIRLLARLQFGAWIGEILVDEFAQGGWVRLVF